MARLNALSRAPLLSPLAKNDLERLAVVGQARVLNSREALFGVGNEGPLV
jgi:hypothetical protein